MFSNEALEVIQFHEDKIEMIQRRLYQYQEDLAKAYQDEWAEINRLIKAGQWDESATFNGNCYGLKVGDEKYVLQLDAALPFIPNTYYRNFEKTYREFYATKLLLSLQIRDIVEQFGDGYMRQAATLFIRHYYHNVILFDLDNKAKQLLINSLQCVLIKKDNTDYLTGFIEDAVRDENENRTMIYLCPYEKLPVTVVEIAERYSNIREIPGVIRGRIPQKAISACLHREDISPQRKTRRRSRKSQKK